jgi:NADPH:quinone reductase-like Zn-dependent oxidoreductase
VAEVGEGTGGLKVGDKVWFLCDKMGMPASCGALSEYVLVPAFAVAPAPAKVAATELAAAPLALLTAYQAMSDAGYTTPGCGKGQSCLVHAGAGGVGHFAIQLAKIFGFDEIATTCSASNADFVRALGATSVCDYTKEDFVQRYTSTPFDLVVDPVTGEPAGPLSSGSPLASYASRSRAVLKRSGVLSGIMTGATLNNAPLGMMGAMIFGLLPALILYKLLGALRGPRYVGPYFLPLASNTAKAGKDLETLRPYVESGRIRAHVLRTFELDEVPTAIATLKAQGHDGAPWTSRERKKFNGKLCVQVAPKSLW